MDLPKINVTDFSRYPLCYFKVNLSDYISAGRRHPSYNYPHPEEVRVVELFSKGVGKKSIKKFEILNTNYHHYEIVRIQDKDHFNDAFACETMRTFISIGTGYPLSFSYIPKNVKTVESIWICTIPQHQMKIPFLFVGRII